MNTDVWRNGYSSFLVENGSKTPLKKYRVKPTVGYRAIWFGIGFSILQGSSPTVGYRFQLPLWHYGGSMKAEDRRLKIEDGGKRENAPLLCAASCRELLAWDCRRKAPSRQTLPAQSMTIWSILNRGPGSARLGGNCSLIPTRCHRLPLGTAVFIIKIFFWAPRFVGRWREPR